MEDTDLKRRSFSPPEDLHNLRLTLCSFLRLFDVSMLFVYSLFVFPYLVETLILKWIQFLNILNIFEHLNIFGVQCKIF